MGGAKWEGVLSSLELDSYIEEMANADANYAVAYALLRVASEINRMGTNAALCNGALNNIAEALRHISSNITCLDSVADELGSIVAAIDVAGSKDS